MKINLKTSKPPLGSAVCLTWLAGLILAAGCAVGPNYHRPAALPGTNALPAQFGDLSVSNLGNWKLAEPAAQIPRGAWWHIYQDAELDRLETMTASNNQQIAVAIANFDEARAAVKVAQANFFPQITANPTITRQRTSANGLASGNNNNLISSSRTYNTFNVSADATWELDLFGRIRRQTESAHAELAASAEDLRSLELSLQAEVAMDYFTLRSLDEESKLLNATVVAYQHALELTQNRQKSGIADELDVAEAETQLRAARAQIPATDLQRAQTRHALAVLCGEPATTFALTPTSLGATNLPAIPVSVPSAWLESRPDISAAERRMAAANANVGVAKTAFYPRLILSGSGGFQSVNASTLFDWPSHLWAVGPSLELPLFTGGLNHAQLESAKAAYYGAVATYRQTVLTAFQDVEDQLTAQYFLAYQLEEETAARDAARRALAIANQRYKAGVEQYLDVITAETTELTHEQTVIQLHGQRLATSASLIKALGTSWNPEAPAPN
jgi:NodT family efflux transporter outer membrane factor (OMF) lipoprotein